MDAPTREQIVQEPAGPQLDGWVAKYVMQQALEPWEKPLPYSRMMAVAWDVVKALHWQWEMGYDPSGWGTFAVFPPHDMDSNEDFKGDCAFKFNSPSEVPRAIKVEAPGPLIRLAPVYDQPLSQGASVCGAPGGYPEVTCQVRPRPAGYFQIPIAGSTRY